MRNTRLPADDLKPLDMPRPTFALGLPLPEVAELDFETGFAEFLHWEAAWRFNPQEQACPN